MKITRWESREINVLVEYEIEADTLEEAVNKLRQIDGTDEWYELEKSLYHFDDKEIADIVKENEPSYIDEKQYWKEIK